MIKYFLLSLLCLIILNFKISPQSLTKLEKHYDNLKNVIVKDNQVLDSLKNILESRAKQIESEKQKQNPDNDKIIKLMSGSVSLSNMIDDQQEKLETDTKNLRQLSGILGNKYSTKIDSLKFLKNPHKKTRRSWTVKFYFIQKNGC